MDTITQAALGACIAQAGFSDKLGRKALVVGAVCGLLPDFDVLMSIGQDGFQYLATHRGWSHSILVLPFVAFPVAWLAQRWARRGKTHTQGDYWLWYLLCFLTLVTHPVLDLFTTYGTQILTPLSNARFAVDAVAIIDPLYTLPLLLALLVGWFKPWRSSARLWAQGALAVSSLYIAIGWHNAQEAKQVAVAQLDDLGAAPADVRVSPAILNNLLWRVVAKDKQGNYLVGFFSTVTKAPIDFEYYSSDRGTLVDKSIATTEGKILQWFSTDMLRAQVEKLEGGGYKVMLTDMRFGLASVPVLSFFGGNFEFDSYDKLTKTYMSEQRRSEVEIGLELDSIWRKIWGGEL